MKTIGQIDLGEYYATPWEWCEESDDYVRGFYRKDGEDMTDEDTKAILQLAGIRGDIKGDRAYLGMQEGDELLLALSKRFEKIKAFQ